MKKLFALFLVLGVVLYACQKETSFENGSTPSHGDLQSDGTGDCFPKNVVGTYVAGTALNGNNDYIEVTVDVTTAGSYTVFTDTVNGVYFRGTGIFTSTGAQVVRLRGTSTPATDGIFNFLVQYDSQSCVVPIEFLPIGTGAAVFTLNGAGGSCTGANIAGTYTQGVALVSTTNTVTINVNVTTIGTYNISATGGGMTFAASGSFSTTGAQTVTLNGSGTPTTPGTNTIPLTVGTASCSFVIPVTASGSTAVGTMGGAGGACTPITPNGTYTAGVALTTSNTVTVQANVTTAGSYTISTNTMNGVSFTLSGNFATTGAQTINLNGTGTPTASGSFTYTVTFGTSTCTFTINFLAAPLLDYYPRTTNSNWSYEFDDDNLDSMRRYVIAPTKSALGNTYNIFMRTDGVTVDSSGYYRKAGTDYHEFFDVGAFIGYDNPQWVDYIFLKDAAAGTNWKTAGYTGTVTVAPNPPQSLTIRFSYTVVQKDVPISFTTSTGTMNYTNVIVVEEKYELQAGPSWTDLTSQVGYGKSYYARGIGLIKYEFFDPSGTLAGQQELRRHLVF